MIILYAITLFIILLYFAYPLWLILITNGTKERQYEGGEITKVSLILLSYNGKIYLEEKIAELLQELKDFEDYELMILDDSSTDGSKQLLKSYETMKNTRVIIQDEHHGIPFAMNLGIREAKFDHIIFCDQRQNLTRNIFKRLLAPLRDKQIGAVSGCISHMDKKDCYSMIRRYENFIKTKESMMGNLIGVYGPLYAITKESYTPIPEHIMLDDLYLSLQIIKNKEIKILGSCKIIDEGIIDLYDYARAKRYLMGFWQILKEKSIWKSLNMKQLTMLVWHKYLRLLIPLMLFLCYAGTGIQGLFNTYFFIGFLFMSLAIVLSMIPFFAKHFKPATFLRINILYFMAMNMLVINALTFKHK